MLFNVKKLANGTRQSYSYNGRLVESHTLSVEPRQFSTTLNDPEPRFQGQAILWCWISPK